MRFALLLSVVVVLLCIAGSSQVVRLSSGGCSVGPSGVMGCSWLGSNPGRDHGIRVNQYALAPQAPLVVEQPEDVILVVADEGLLLDETNVPASHINMFKGTALLVPKGKKTVLRNGGDKALLLVEIVLHDSSR